jgi:hypothetical protein
MVGFLNLFFFAFQGLGLSLSPAGEASMVALRIPEPCSEVSNRLLLDLMEPVSFNAPNVKPP